MPNEPVRKPRVSVEVPCPRGTVTPAARYALPFIVAVVGDFAGAYGRSPAPLAWRRFEAIDRDGAERVLAQQPYVMRDDSRQALEGLIGATATSPMLQLTFCAVSKQELRADLLAGSEPRASWLSRSLRSVQRA
jgi:hypothetical protein